MRREDLPRQLDVADSQRLPYGWTGSHLRCLLSLVDYGEVGGQRDGAEGRGRGVAGGDGARGGAWKGQLARLFTRLPRGQCQHTQASVHRYGSSRDLVTVGGVCRPDAWKGMGPVSTCSAPAVPL